MRAEPKAAEGFRVVMQVDPDHPERFAITCRVTRDGDTRPATLAEIRQVFRHASLWVRSRRFAAAWLEHHVGRLDDHLDANGEA